jgi:hypothetical protein
MTYQVFYYDDRVPLSIKKWRNEDATLIEMFGTEHEAFHRARDLLDGNPRSSVVIHDDSGNVLGGMLLQLKLEPGST